MAAKEYFNEWKEEQPFGKLTQTFNKGYVLDECTLFEFAEAYLKSEANAISDELINKEAKISDSVHFTNGFEYGAKWFKQLLLKQ